jgi:23S rRNA pseudouridine1911/1915/1917 synthase
MRMHGPLAMMAQDDPLAMPVHGQVNTVNNPEIRPVILFEDNHLLIAVKPAGILSQADASGKPDMLTILKQDIKQRYQKPGEVFLGLVHRLDQPVAGVMVFARTSKAASRLSEQIRSHQLEKYYLAVVHGQPAPSQGRLEDWLIKDETTRMVRVCPAGTGQPAMLDYAVLAVDAELDQSLVAIRLGTGRSHQIRVQFASRGWPLVGDQRYGTGRANLDIALYACILRMKHPTRDEQITGQHLPNWIPPWQSFPQPDLQQILSLFPGE